MEDKDIVKHVLQGEALYFEYIIDKYEGPILKYIYSFIGDRTMAEDLCQETFISVYNKLYTYNNISKFSTWIYSIAHNKSIDYLRKITKNREIAIDNIKDSLSREKSPQEIVEYKETLDSIEGFIKNLDIIDKQILYLRYAHPDVSFRDISNMMGMNESTVKKRYYRLYDKYEVYLDRNLKGGVGLGLSKIQK
ncbi:RNA polymerase sigma factor [Clostridium folliculivorans]|uniref:RNA polymerase sigma factor n=1 Tax=Clostridium folliculivorans TaxID=2886038 RepID=A0A9W5Y6D7_9CLOT|nr:RNA polymerase sigma factor [Clostridium folliculivorans]GKU27394.1 RNA polymerase sigma factor [Clostridium folliculivorans]GKU32245.1 RNA polymerase sigma factor [Clostridium folliculivorans]